MITDGPYCNDKLVDVILKRVHDERWAPETHDLIAMILAMS
jgi:hypothetical protein